jgi:hypothetical protein
VTDSGILLVKDPDVLRTPTRGIVVQLGEKRGTIDLDDVVSALSELDSPRYLTSIPDVIALLKKFRPAPFDVALGDCVLFSPGAGDAFEKDGIDYCVVRESDIIGVVEPIQKEVAA